MGMLLLDSEIIPVRHGGYTLRLLSHGTWRDST
jgi:hypothetical protein